MSKRDKFLTEAMGDCYHEFKSLTGNEAGNGFICDTCEGSFRGDISQIKARTRNDFLTWEGFGKLWGWAKEQEWWRHFQDMIIGGAEIYEDESVDEYIFIEFINPDNFANAVYEFLKEEL